MLPSLLTVLVLHKRSLPSKENAIADQSNNIGCVANPTCVLDAVRAMCIVENDPCFAIASSATRSVYPD